MKNYHKFIFSFVILGLFVGGCAKLATPESENPKSISPAKVKKKQLTTVWSFNEGEGKSCKTNNDKDKALSLGINNRSPLWSQGVEGKALYFAGRGCARGIAPDYFKLEEPFTVDFFAKMTSPPPGVYGGLYDQMIYRKAGFRIMVTAYGQVTWNIQRTNEDEFVMIRGPKLELGKWRHLAFVNDNGKLSIYCDGKLSKEVKIKGQIKQTINDKNGKPVSANIIMLGHTGGKNYNFNGSIDRLRLSNFARDDFLQELEILKKSKELEVASSIKEKAIKPKDSGINLLENGSFESDLTLWNSRMWGVPDPANAGNFKIVTDEKTDGKKALCLDRMARITMTAQLLPVKQGRTYTFSADIKTDNPNNYLYMRAYSPRNTYVGVKTKKHIKPSSEWKRYSYTFKIPEKWTDRMSCDFFVPKSPGKIWIDRVTVIPGEAKETAKSEILMGLTTAKTANVFFKGEKVQANLDIMNNPADKGAISFQVKNINNDVVFSKNLPAKSQSIDLPLGLGLYSIQASYVSSANKPVIVSNRIAVLPKNEASKFFGVQCTPYTSFIPHSLIDHSLKIMKIWGVRTVRTDLTTRKVMMELNPDSHSMHFFKTAKKLKLSTLCVLDRYLDKFWSGDYVFNTKKQNPDADFVTEEDLLNWGKSATHVLKQLNSYIDYIEVLNEPNCIRSPGGQKIPGDEYMKVVEKTYEVARKHTPSIKIVAGSMTGLARARFQFFEEMLREERNRKFFDAISFHPYGPSNEDDVYKDVLSLRKLIDKFCLGIPLLATELGLCSYENPSYGIKAGMGGPGGNLTTNCHMTCAINNGERIQCRQIVKNLIACKALGVKVFINHGWESGNWGAIMDKQGNAGLLAGAYGFLSRFLHNVDSLEFIEMGEALRTFAFKLPDGRTGAFIWTFGESSKARITLKTKPENIVIRDITGFRHKAASETADSTTVQLSHMPQLIITPKFNTKLLKQCLKNADLTGFKGTVSAHISISSPKQIQLRLKSKTNKEQSLSDAKLILTNNNQQEVIKLKDMLVKPDKFLVLKLALKNKLSQGLTSITLSAKLNGSVDFSSKQDIRLLNSYKVKNIKADGNLDDWQNHTPIQLGEGNLKKFSDWKGSNDHNAKLWLGYDEKNFYVAAEVTDDKHVNTGRTPWRGDSVQIYFDPLCDSQQAADRDVDDFEFNLYLKDEKDMIFRRDKVAQFELSGLRYTGEIPEKLVKRSILRKGDKTIYEIIIPKDQLTPTELGDGKSLRFSVFINDNDKVLPSGEKKMEKRDSGLSLTGKGSEPYKNHKEWSEILFIEK